MHKKEQLIKDLLKKLQTRSQQQKYIAKTMLDDMENAYQISNILRRLGRKVIYSSSKTIQQSLLFKPLLQGQKTLRFDAHGGLNRQYIDYESAILQKRGKQQFSSMVISELDQRVPEFGDLTRLISQDNQQQQKKLSYFEQYNWEPYCRFLSICVTITNNQFIQFKQDYQEIRQRIQLEGKIISNQILNQADQCLKEFASTLKSEIEEHGRLQIKNKLIKNIDVPDDLHFRNLVFILLYNKAQTLIYQGVKTNKVVLQRQELTRIKGFRNLYDFIENQFSTLKFQYTSAGKRLISYTLNLSPHICQSIIRELVLVKISPKKQYHQKMNIDYKQKFNGQSKFGMQIQTEIIEILKNKIQIRIKDFQRQKPFLFVSTYPSKIIAPLNNKFNSIEDNFKEAFDQTNLKNTADKIFCLPFTKSNKKNPNSASIDFLFSSKHEKQQDTIFIESVDVTVGKTKEYILNKASQAFAQFEQLLNEYEQRKPKNGIKRKIIWTHYIWTQFHLSKKDYNEATKNSLKLDYSQLNIVFLDLKTLTVSKGDDIKYRQSTVLPNVSNLIYIIDELNKYAEQSR